MERMRLDENPMIRIAVEYAAQYNGRTFQEEMEELIDEENCRYTGLLHFGTGGRNHQPAKTS